MAVFTLQHLSADCAAASRRLGRLRVPNSRGRRTYGWARRVACIVLVGSGVLVGMADGSTSGGFLNIWDQHWYHHHHRHVFESLVGEAPQELRKGGCVLQNIALSFA